MLCIASVANFCWLWSRRNVRFLLRILKALFSVSNGAGNYVFGVFFSFLAIFITFLKVFFQFLIFFSFAGNHSHYTSGFSEGKACDSNSRCRSFEANT